MKQGREIVFGRAGDAFADPGTRCAAIRVKAGATGGIGAKAGSPGGKSGDS